MANEIFKEIKTKIALKTLSYAEWDAIKDTYKPLKGEVCVCTIPEGNAAATTAPTVMFKVGDGTNFFGALKWASALAADVYGWAKENALFIHKDGTGNVVSGVEWDASLNGGKGGVKYTTAAVATAEGLEDLQEAVAAIEKDIADNRDAWVLDTDTRYSFSTDGDKLVVKKTLYTNGVAGAEEAVGTYEFLTADEVAKTLEGYYTKSEVDGLIQGVEAKLPTSADYGVLGVTAGDDTITVGGTAQNPTIAVTANKFDAYGAAAQALADAKDYADKKPHENTAHTHSVGAGLVKTGDGGISGNVEYSANIDVKYENSKIYLVDKTSGATIGNGFDASVFVKDSYLQSVSYNDATNVLTFVFVDNEDKLEAIPVDLNDLVDVYTADETSLTKTGAEFSIKDGGVSTVKIANDAVTADKLADAINEDIAKGVAAKTVTDTLKGLAFQDKIDNSDIDDNSIAVGKIANFTTEVAAVKVTNAGHADSADEATHATNADEATHAVNADNATNADKLDDHDSTYFATKEALDALNERTYGYSADYGTDESPLVAPGINISAVEYIDIHSETHIGIRSSFGIDLEGETSVDGSLKVNNDPVVTNSEVSAIGFSGSIYDVAEASKTEDDVVYLLLDCNW